MTMTDAGEFGSQAGLVERLTELGDVLALDERGLIDATLTRIGEQSSARRGGHGWLIAAVIVALIAGIVLHPDSRHAIARWFGLEGVVIEVDQTLHLPPPAPTFESPGPGESRVAIVGGREVLISAIDGRLNEQLINKTVGSSDQVQAVEVLGLPGLWIGGAPHEVLYESVDGDVVVRRVAGNTLLWHDGAVLFRVEGFENVEDAISFVEGT